MNLPLAVGLDLGTGGARAVVARADGELVASGSSPIGTRPDPAHPERHEQDAELWWDAARAALAEALAALPSGARGAIRALCVDGTSGTLVGVDEEGAVTTPALMYNDGRAVEEARELNALSREAAGASARLTATHGLAKLRWLERHAPSAFEASRRFVHQADLVAERLSGRRGVSDWSNALKTGFDVEALAWPGWLDALPRLRERLPEVVAPGSVLGPLRPEVARALDLPRDAQVVAGVTDGTAAFLASGASRQGDDNTTLGTTLVFKRLAGARVRDPEGLFYCHRLPGDVWLPGAASNTGGDWLQREFAGADLAALDAAAEALLPVEQLAYPLCVRGERFPFLAPDARGFVDPPTDDPLRRYAARLQGTALVERLAYERLDRSAPSTGEVFATGGGSRSDVWTQLRADVSGRTYHRPAHPESAFGSAVLAMAGALGRDLWSTSRAMVRIADTFRPRPERRARYDAYHRRFVALLEQHGHLPPPPRP